MISDYQFYHGALLREIIVKSRRDVRIALRDFHGRPDAYLIGGSIGLLIKHSGARLTPWTFTFMKEHLAELREMRAVTKVCFIGLVCNEDGFVCVRDVDLMGILLREAVPDTDALSVRVDRRVGRMYRVSSSGHEIDRRLARGVHDIVREIELQNIECAPPSSAT